jgi:hypothetical protein
MKMMVVVVIMMCGDDYHDNDDIDEQRGVHSDCSDGTRSGTLVPRLLSHALSLRPLRRVG